MTITLQLVAALLVLLGGAAAAFTLRDLVRRRVDLTSVGGARLLVEFIGLSALALDGVVWLVTGQRFARTLVMVLVVSASVSLLLRLAERSTPARGSDGQTPGR